MHVCGVFPQVFAVRDSVGGRTSVHVCEGSPCVFVVLVGGPR